jgi:uncharacterized membrane protein YtjA (UPF0391 family)
MARGTTSTWRPLAREEEDLAPAEDRLLDEHGPASLCGLAYRRPSFGSVACKLGAGIKSNLDVAICCPFMVIALIAALLGFSGIAARVAGMAQVPFWLFLALSPTMPSPAVVVTAYRPDPDKWSTDFLRRKR